MLRLFKKRHRSPIWAAVKTVGAAVGFGFVSSLLFASAGGEVEEFGRGVTRIIAGATVIYLLTVAYLCRRGIRSAGDLLFIREGGIWLIMGALIGYCLAAEVEAGA